MRLLVAGPLESTFIRQCFVFGCWQKQQEDVCRAVMPPKRHALLARPPFCVAYRLYLTGLTAACQRPGKGSALL